MLQLINVTHVEIPPVLIEKSDNVKAIIYDISSSEVLSAGNKMCYICEYLCIVGQKRRSYSKVTL